MKFSNLQPTVLRSIRWFVAALILAGVAFFSWPAVQSMVKSMLSARLYAVAAEHHEHARYDKALPLAESALRWSQAGRDDGLFQLRVHHLLGVIHHSMSRPEQAQHHYEKALEFAGAVEAPAVAVFTTEALAQLHSEAGHFEKAMRLYEEAYAYRVNETPLAPEYFTTAVQLAYLFRDLSDYQLGVGVEVLLLEHLRKEKAANAPEVVQSLTRLGLLYANRGQLEDAERTFEQATELAEGNQDLSLSSKADLLNNRGILLHYQEKWSEALALFELSLRMRMEQSGETSAGVAQSHHNLGRLYLEQKSLNSAQHHAEKALRASEASNGVSHPYTVNSIELLIEIYQAQGNQDAEQRMRERLAGIAAEKS
jgi:tetratricopeptide (TPR) repeat protein